MPEPRHGIRRGHGLDPAGTTTRVLRRVDRCIDEKTGKLLSMKNPCIVLEGVVCQGVYHAHCPRGYVAFWREIWLERVALERGKASRDA